MKKSTSFIPQESIEGKILFIRGKKVMLDRDLAALYGVETSYLKRQVKRNIERFPEDFMFQLSKEELGNWKCQFVTSNSTDKIGCVPIFLSLFS
ncbi:MAG: ORF6N domain-containing protein [Candidatus Scalindua sp.]